MVKPFQKTDKLIDSYETIKLLTSHNSVEFQSDLSVSREALQTKLKLINNTFIEEYEELEENRIYFYGCSFENYRYNYERRKKEFLESFEDYTLQDFLYSEFKQGLFEFDRAYLDEKLKSNILASLKKRYNFLRIEAHKNNLELQIINNSQVEIIDHTTLGDINTDIIEEDLENDDKKLSIAKKIILLNQLGVLDYLLKKHPYNNTCNALSRTLSLLLEEKAGSINRYLNPIANPTVDQVRNPMNTKKNVEYINLLLQEIGFRQN